MHIFVTFVLKTTFEGSLRRNKVQYIDLYVLLPKYHHHQAQRLVNAFYRNVVFIFL